MFNLKLSPLNYVWSLFISIILVLSFFRVGLSLLYSERIETPEALNNDRTPERAMMQFYSNYAYIEDSKAVILQPGGKASIWHYDKATKYQSETSAVEEALNQRAKAHVLLPNFLYQNHLYSSNHSKLTKTKYMLKTNDNN